jgi:hypothetical protein
MICKGNAIYSLVYLYDKEIQIQGKFVTNLVTLVLAKNPIYLNQQLRSYKHYQPCVTYSN